MSSVYLSPSLQDRHIYAAGAENEETYMNRIADAMAPLLRKNGISFTRNDPYDTLPRIIRRSNTQGPDLHVALHSNAAPENLSGLIQGPDIYYYAPSSQGRKAARIFAQSLKSIYPVPALVAVIPSASLPELKKTKAPAILAELAYHDNEEDARWLLDHTGEIARALVFAIKEYLRSD